VRTSKIRSLRTLQGVRAADKIAQPPTPRPTASDLTVTYRHLPSLTLAAARHLALAEAPLGGQKADRSGRRVGPRPAVACAERPGFLGQVERVRDREAAGSIVPALRVREEVPGQRGIKEIPNGRRVREESEGITSELGPS